MQAKDFSKELIQTVKKICTPGKGILAADESPGSVDKKFKPIGLENNSENRRRYREMLLTAPGLENYISGVIFQEETAKQATKDGKSFVEYLQEKGVVPGIKVDKGLGILNKKNENYTKGLDSLPAMCKEFYALGFRFAKWRAVLQICDGCPSEQSIEENAWGLARYAAICQENGLVPIVEPEILSDGPHSAEDCQKISEKVFSAVFSALQKNHVLLEGALLKPNMVTYGSEHPNKKNNNIKQQAIRTVRALSRTVPPALGGITFLSGGQTEQQASLHLNLMNQIEDIRRPWFLSFSFGRALQNSSLKAWHGKDENVHAGQEALLGRAKANSESQLGKYQGSTDKSANESLFEASYSQQESLQFINQYTNLGKQSKESQMDPQDTKKIEGDKEAAVLQGSEPKVSEGNDQQARQSGQNQEDSNADQENSDVEIGSQSKSNDNLQKVEKQQDEEQSMRENKLNQQYESNLKKVLTETPIITGRKCFNKLCSSKKIYKKIRSKVQQAKYRFLCKSCYDCYVRSCYCEFCEQIYSSNYDNDDEDLKWIGCDNCERWNHVECQKKYRDKNITDMREKETQYYCLTCTQKARSAGNDGQQYKASNRNGNEVILPKQDVLIAKRLKNRQLEINKQDRFLVFHKKCEQLINLQGFLQSYNFRICISQGLIRQDLDNLRHSSSSTVKRSAMNNIQEVNRQKKIKIND